MNKEAKEILLDKDVDGISYYDPEQKTFVIYYRHDKIKERLRFTIAHEIGHIRMGHKVESDLARRIADYYPTFIFRCAVIMLKSLGTIKLPKKASFLQIYSEAKVFPKICF